MTDVFEYFVRKKEFLFCVDSDGCAMDTMDVKHRKCFGPCLIDEWNLKDQEQTVLKRWNEINLYSMTRGINRFKGLARLLRELQDCGTEMEGLEAFEAWTENAPELSEASLEAEIERNEAVCMRKALSWSRSVNEHITLLEDEEKKPFPGVAEALKEIHKYADIAVVSSANLQAVLEEWDLYSLLEHTDIVLAQDVGSKQYCIEQMLRYGYDRNRVLMAGDAPGDLDAAASNGVFCFPVLAGREAESWNELKGPGLTVLLNGTYGGAYQERKIDEFKENLLKGQEEKTW